MWFNYIQFYYFFIFFYLGFHSFLHWSLINSWRTWGKKNTVNWQKNLSLRRALLSVSISPKATILSDHTGAVLDHLTIICFPFILKILYCLSKGTRKRSIWIIKMYLTCKIKACFKSKLELHGNRNWNV